LRVANIYGVKPVLEALRAGGRRIERVMIADSGRTERLHEILQAAKKAGIEVRREPRAALDRLAPGANHQGVIAVTSAIQYRDAHDLLEGISTKSLFILLDGIEDPHNLGAIIRTAECAGASALIIPQRRSAHVTDIVAKTSAGAVEYVPIAVVTNLASYIEQLKAKNVWVAGVDVSEGTVYTDYDYSGAHALVFGGEGHGLHRLVRERCDVTLSIPMAGKVGSLNVSVAVGVVLFEALRRRGSGASRENG
jgi:23S rRNA (guanosine2251-2'-O)-methyltransferase